MLKDSATPWDGLPALSACCCCSLSAFDEDTKACAPAGSLYEALADCVRSRESRVRRGGPLLLLERARQAAGARPRAGRPWQLQTARQPSRCPRPMPICADTTSSPPFPVTCAQAANKTRDEPLSFPSAVGAQERGSGPHREAV